MVQRRPDDLPDVLDHTTRDELRQLRSVSYRLLGSVSDAEDAVQEAYTRWYALAEESRASVQSRVAWLTKVASRICLDMLRSARFRREQYVGQWIPEPLPVTSGNQSGRHDAGFPDPADRVALDESISMAFMIMLEAMTPAERVAFILHDVFHFPFAEIADITGRSSGACRQLALSARRRIDAERTTVAPTAEHVRVVREFKRAWESMDIAALLALLDPDAVVIPDGGGLVQAALEPVRGPLQIARLYAGFVGSHSEASILERTVNGQLGLIVRLDGRTDSVFAFDVADGRIQQIWAVRNPEKLRAWNS